MNVKTVGTDVHTKQFVEIIYHLEESIRLGIESGDPDS